MKKTFMMTALAACICAAAPAQKIGANKVPVAAKASFAKAYPGVMARWEKEKGNYEVNFKLKGTNMSVLMNGKGIIAETEAEIKVADLPATVLSYVKEHYKGRPVKEGAKITKADGTVNYEAEIGGKDVTFSENGKFLKEAKD